MSNLTCLPEPFEYVRLAWNILLGTIHSVWKLIFPPAPKPLKNEIILVTGGAHGIGKAILFEIATIEKELTLISWDIDGKTNEETVVALRSFGVQRVFGFTVDLSDEVQIAAAGAKVRQDVGDPFMVFNNAGMCGPLGRAWQLDSEQVRKTFQVNFLSHLWINREFLPPMIQNRRGHIIGISSSLGFFLGHSGSPYVVTKHALRVHYECLKEDLRKYEPESNIIVSLVYPHHVGTDLTAPLNFGCKKFPSLMSPWTPGKAASVIVNGVRRNQEHVFFPTLFRFCLPMVSTLTGDAFRSVVDTLDYNFNVVTTTKPKLDTEYNRLG